MTMSFSRSTFSTERNTDASSVGFDPLDFGSQSISHPNVCFSRDFVKAALLF